MPAPNSLSSPKEYREFALRCSREAAATSDLRLRAILLETARLWLEAALHVEKSWALSEDQPAQPPGPVRQP
jgi:hypothetical protein